MRKPKGIWNSQPISTAICRKCITISVKYTGWKDNASRRPYLMNAPWSLAPGSVSAEEGLEAARHECGVIKRKSFIGGGKKLDERKSFTEGGKKLDERKSFTGGGKKLNVW